MEYKSDNKNTPDTIAQEAGHKKALDIAFELKKAGLDSEFISNATGLDIEEVEKLDAPLNGRTVFDIQDDYVWQMKPKWDFDNVTNYSISERVDKRDELTQEEKDQYKRFLKKRFDKLWEARNLKRRTEIPGNPQLSNQEIADMVDMPLDSVEYFFREALFTT
jgi:hypothetical protein